MRVDAAMLCRLRVVLLAAALGLLGSAPGAGAATAPPARCPGADLPAAAASAATMRGAVVCLVNQQRAAWRLPSLSASARLDRSAQTWTNAMIKTATFSHGADFSARISSAGYFWASAGENIATGFQTPRQVVTAWMGSADHCHNILDPVYADVGTGVSPQPLAQYTPSTWTQDFGLWMGRPARSHNYGPSRGCPYRS